MNHHLAKTMLASAAAVTLLTTLQFAPVASLQAADASRPVKVFLLAGQSNMKGKAPNALFDHQATNGSTKALFAHLRRDDQWIVRDDVFNSPWFYDYRMKGKTTLFTLGYNLSFGTKDSMDFAWRHVQSKPDKSLNYAAPIRYFDNHFSISYLMAF